jgi:trigger factor
VGGAKELTYELADGSSRTVTATVNELRTKVLPPLDDELARSVSEFDELEVLRAAVEEALREQLGDELETQFRSDVVDALVQASNVNAAGALVDSRTRELLRGLVRSLERRGIDPSVYLAMTGQTAEELEERMRAEASQSVARELVLEAAAERLGIEVTDAEVDDLIRGQAEEVGEDPEATVAEVAASGARERLRDDLRLRKALDRIASEVKRIPAELASAREKLWTPEQEKKSGDTKLWTPGSKETQ